MKRGTFNPFTAIMEHPEMNAYDAVEIAKPRSELIGLRITKEDKNFLKKVAKEKGATATQIAYLFLKKKMVEYSFSVNPAPKSERGEEIVSEKMRWEVLEKGDFRCKKCGSRQFLHVDHIHPRSKGGKATVSNLQILCKRCNTKKGNKV